MRDKGSYRDLLGERIENAYREKGDISKPTEIQMAKWKQIAKMRRREKIRRRKIIASLASVFAMVFCVGMVSMFQIPDAEAGRDGIVDIIDSEDDDEVMIVDEYKDYKDLLLEYGEDFLMFKNVPLDCKMSGARVISIGKEKRLEAEFVYERGSSFLIRQESNNSDGAFKEVVVKGDKVIDVNGIDVHIKKYLTGDQKILYAYIYNNIYVNIMFDGDISEKETIDIIKETIN